MGKGDEETITEQDVQTLDSDTLAKAQPGPGMLATDAIRARLAQDILRSGGEDVMGRIGDEIMNAETAADVLEGGDVLAAEEILDTPLEIQGFVLREAYDEYPDQIAFAVIDAVQVETGEETLITCGGFNVMNALIRLDQLDAFPVRCMFRQAGRALRLYRPKGDKTVQTERVQS